MWSTPLSPAPSLYPRDEHSKAEMQPSMKSPSGCSMAACWDPCTAGGSWMVLSVLLRVKCLHLRTSVGSAPLLAGGHTWLFQLQNHWIPIYTLVHSSAALLAIPCCFLINSGTEWCLPTSKGQPLQIQGNPTKYKLGKSTVSAGVPAKSPVLDLQQSKHHINQRNTWNNPFSVVLH